MSDNALNPSLLCRKINGTRGINIHSPHISPVITTERDELTYKEEHINTSESNIKLTDRIKGRDMIQDCNNLRADFFDRLNELCSQTIRIKALTSKRLYTNPDHGATLAPQPFAGAINNNRAHTRHVSFHYDKYRQYC